MSDDLVKKLRDGVIEHAKRWSGDTHWDLGGSVDYDATDALMEKAADRIEELEAERDDYAFKLAEANNTYSEMHVVMSEANDKLAKAVWRLEQMRDDRTGYRHPSHYIRGAAVTLAELKGAEDADRT